MEGNTLVIEEDDVERRGESPRMIDDGPEHENVVPSSILSTLCEIRPGREGLVFPVCQNVRELPSPHIPSHNS